jgi:hypothetical protein
MREIVGLEANDDVDRAGTEDNELAEEAAEIGSDIFCMENTMGSGGVAVGVGWGVREGD